MKNEVSISGQEKISFTEVRIQLIENSSKFSKKERNPMTMSSRRGENC